MLARRMSNNCPPRNQCPGYKEPNKNSPKPEKPPPSIFSGIFEPPDFIRTIGPKQIAEKKLQLPGVITWSLFGVVTGLYFTDWKVVTGWIPFYNGKYRIPDDIPPPPPAVKEKDSEAPKESGKDPVDIGAKAAAAARAIDEAAKGGSGASASTKKRNDEC